MAPSFWLRGIRRRALSTVYILSINMPYTGFFHRNLAVLRFDPETVSVHLVSCFPNPLNDILQRIPSTLQLPDSRPSKVFSFEHRSWVISSFATRSYSLTRVFVAGSTVGGCVICFGAHI
jgi:hypothetical protein